MDTSFAVRSVNTFDNATYRQERKRERERQMLEMEAAFATADMLRDDIVAFSRLDQFRDNGRGLVADMYGPNLAPPSSEERIENENPVDEVSLPFFTKLDTTSCTEQASTKSTIFFGDAKLDCKVVFLSDTSPAALDVEPGARMDAQETLLLFETKRRSIHHSKLEAIRFRWRSLLSILHEGLQETQRSERLVVGFARANQVYASAMEATYDDTIEGLLDCSLANSTEGASSSDYELSHTSTEINIEDDSATLNESTAEDLLGGTLSSVIESQSSVAEQFAKDAILMSMGVGKDITSLRSEFKTSIDKVERLGNAVIAELENIEEQVAEAWGKSCSVFMLLLLPLL